MYFKVQKLSSIVFMVFLVSLFIGDAINDVINQNFETVSEDIIPLIEKALQRTFKKIANKICSRYTFDQLFPN